MLFCDAKPMIAVQSKLATKSVRAFCGRFSILLGFTFFLQFPMQTTAQRLGYTFGLDFYLLSKKGYDEYVADVNENSTDSAKFIRLARISNMLYQQIKDIDVETFLQQRKAHHANRLEKIWGELYRKHFISLGRSTIDRIILYPQKDWRNETSTSSIYHLEKQYLYFTSSEIYSDLWFMPMYNNAMFSEEFLTHLQNIAPVWQNVLAGESKWLNSLQIGYKESESNYIIDESVLKKTYDSLLRNSPTHDARLQEDYELMLSMLERCISGECYFVMQSL
jgi:hypothetical protein